MSERTQVTAAELDDAAQALQLTWGDGHASSYPLAYVRAECPCASCRQAREESRSNPFHVIKGEPPSTKLSNVEAVGRYGLRLTWSDGHNTGIYAFDYLREICPCDACRAERTGADVPYVHGIYIPR